MLLAWNIESVAFERWLVCQLEWQKDHILNDGNKNVLN